MLITDIIDDCILGIDFFRKVNLLGIFKSEFNSKVPQNYETLICSWIISEEKFLEFLREFFQSSEKLSDAQKKDLALFLSKFQDGFTEDISAENYKILKHSMSSMQNQLNRHREGLIHLRQKDELIINQIKRQEVNEQNSWVSPAVMVRKKDESLRFYVDYLGNLMRWL